MGCTSQALIKVHKTFVLSKLDDGAPVFSTAKYLKILDPIHNEGCRLSIGAFRSSPIKSILNISGILPLLS
jgi:hypothetical protein